MFPDLRYLAAANRPPTTAGYSVDGTPYLPAGGLPPDADPCHPTLSRTLRRSFSCIGRGLPDFMVFLVEVPRPIRFPSSSAACHSISAKHL